MDVDLGHQEEPLLNSIGDKDAALKSPDRNSTILGVEDDKDATLKSPLEENDNGKTLAGGKRGAPSDLGGNKKARVGDVGREIKRVAEIVLVLSAMGKIRAGRAPTEEEKRIMGEAREILVGVCQGIPPKEIGPREALRGLIQDLGLNRPKDPRLSFRPPLMSIKEKLQLSKRKMEESQKFLQSGKHSSQLLQASPGAKEENPSAFARTTQRFQPDISGQVAVPPRSFATPSPMFYANGMQPTMVSTGTLNSPFKRDTSSLPLAHTEPVHFRLDGRPNVPGYASQVQANSSGGHLLGKTTVGAPEHQLGDVARVGLANQVPDPTVEVQAAVGTSQIAPLNTRDPNQSTTGTVFNVPQAVQQPLQGLNISHDEIAKLVQTFLHPNPPEHPNWTPPSNDYMHKTLTCQVCKCPLDDVKSLLVCDACEKGTHIKCLAPYIQRRIPQADWHCPHCLAGNHGKPLPTRYGPVVSSNSIPKVTPNAALVQCSAVKKVESADEKVNHQKATANGNLGSLHDVHVGAVNAQMQQQLV